MFECRDTSRRSPTFLSVFHIILLAASAFSSFLPRASAFAFCSGSLANLSLRSHPINSRTVQHNVRPADIRQRCLSGVSNLKAIEFAQPEFTTYPQQIFTLVNFAVLPFWAAMIAAPKNSEVIAVMKSSVPILICAAMHLSLVLYGLSQPGSAEEFTFLATQGFVKLSAMQEMRQYPVFVSEEWAHVLAWDLFVITHPVGRWVYLDGLDKEVPTPCSLALCFILGPVGMTAHLITRAIWLKDPSSLFKL